MVIRGAGLLCSSGLERHLVTTTSKNFSLFLKFQSRKSLVFQVILVIVDKRGSPLPFFALILVTLFKVNTIT